MKFPQVLRMIDNLLFHWSAVNHYAPNVPTWYNCQSLCALIGDTPSQFSCQSLMHPKWSCPLTVDQLFPDHHEKCRDFKVLQGDQQSQTRKNPLR